MIGFANSDFKKRGPSLVMGGMKSELVPTEPSQTYPTATVVISI